MGAILKIITRLASMLTKRFRRAKVSREVNIQAEMLKVVSRADQAIYQSIIIQLKNDPDIAKYGADVRLLHRRLAQYERMRNHASLVDQDRALRKLEKQWRKVEGNSNRKKHKESSYVVNGDLDSVRPSSRRGLNTHSAPGAC